MTLLISESNESVQLESSMYFSILTKKYHMRHNDPLIRMPKIEKITTASVGKDIKA